MRRVVVGMRCNIARASTCRKPSEKALLGAFNAVGRLQLFSFTWNLEVKSALAVRSFYVASSFIGARGMRVGLLRSIGHVGSDGTILLGSG